DPVGAGGMPPRDPGRTLHHETGREGPAAGPPRLLRRQAPASRARQRSRAIPAARDGHHHAGLERRPCRDDRRLHVPVPRRDELPATLRRTATTSGRSSRLLATEMSAQISLGALARLWLTAMHFELVGEITGVVMIASGRGIRDLVRLRRRHGPGRWRKRKGVAAVRL